MNDDRRDLEQSLAEEIADQAAMDPQMIGLRGPDGVVKVWVDRDIARSWGEKNLDFDIVERADQGLPAIDSEDDAEVRKVMADLFRYIMSDDCP